MGLFDKMFGRGAAQAQQQPNAEPRFNELKQKYQSALNLADQLHLQFHNLHVQDNKLFIRATAPSQEAASKFWDQLKLINPNLDDVIADIPVAQQQAQSAAAGGEIGQAPGSRIYTVKPGDTLSKISREFYGDAHEYMRIFYANRDKLSDPDKIQVGQQLVIPPDTNS